jgi:hypothetical protein
MREMGRFWITMMATVVLLAGGLQSDAATQRGFSDDFESGLANWEMTDPKAWEIVENSAGNRSLGLVRASDYEPAVRSPLNIALVKDREFGSFELTVNMKQTGREYGHRDLCLFFGHQDPSHFYYVHLASTADAHANSIFLVNGAPRVSIAATRTDGTKWDDQYHTVRIVRDAESGSIRVYFDDMTAPVMTATDKTFTTGRVGVGSFDDVGEFDDFVVSPLEAE